MRLSLSMILIASCGALSASCADVLFEKSPYAPVRLQVAYSAQEDLTFLVWRLGRAADAGRVRFELAMPGQSWAPLDLERAPYPSAGFPCDGDYICFQYQLPGRVDWDAEARPVRALADGAVYAGGRPTAYETEVSFGIDPIGLARNRAIDPARYDWFGASGVPIDRDYEWQLVDAERATAALDPDLSGCDEPEPGRWARMGREVEPERAWYERPRCFAARPVARAGYQNEPVVVGLAPSAMLASEEQFYVPEQARPPAIVVTLFDALIRGEARCQSARRAIESEIGAMFDRRSFGSIDLGTFVPLDAESGEPLSGCDQRADQDDPITAMRAAIAEAARSLEPETVRVVLFYVNNAELPPSERVLAGLFELAIALESVENARAFKVAIASNAIINPPSVDGLGANVLWEEGIGWRPPTDPTLIGDLVAWGDYALPFSTMVHDNPTFAPIDGGRVRIEEGTRVAVARPKGARRRPERFRFCGAIVPLAIGDGSQGVGEFGFEENTQAIVAAELEGGRVVRYPESRTLPWPGDDQLSIFFELGRQEVVPFAEYQRVEIAWRVETCERFCDLPFVDAAGMRHASWASAPQCQAERLVADFEEELGPIEPEGAR